MKTLYLQVRFAMLLLMAVFCLVFWLWPVEAFHTIRRY